LSFPDTRTFVIIAIYLSVPTDTFAKIIVKIKVAPFYGMKVFVFLCVCMNDD